MGLFDKLFKRNKEQQEQKEALDEGLKKFENRVR
jgi:fused signal recognition particle receptor